MVDQIRIIVEHFVDGNLTEQTIIVNKEIGKVSSISELGFNHQQQMDLIKACQDALLKIQSQDLQSDIQFCPKCGAKLKLAGHALSHFHAVLSDHKVSVKRKKCCNNKCGWTSVPSISSLFNTNVHPDLSKLQTEMACNHTYREAQNILNAISYYPRKINNHEHIYRTIEIVGNYISAHQINEIPDDISPVEELICQVDGGHLKAKEEGSRSFEALACVIYAPQNVTYSDKNESTILKDDDILRGKILSKHCAASALDDNQESIKRQTLVAALKQGMTIETHITALCDGANNCWNVVDSLEEQCHSITRIVDWFHIAMRFKNISLSKELAEKLNRLKWCIWHGMADEGLSRFDEIIAQASVDKMKERLTKLQSYLGNNKNYLVNYSERYKTGKVISSSLAESTIESLINKRCKGKQHMKWSREGAHPLLQIRASCASNDWLIFGADYVLNATTQIAA